MLSMLTDLGWVINWEKLSLELSQVKQFLGLIVDTTLEPQFWVLTTKAHALCHNIVHLL